MSFSLFLKEMKPKAQKLVEELSKDFEYASMLGSHVETRNLGVSSTTNLMVNPTAECGDYYENFSRLVWSALTSTAFAQGQIDGYFKNNVSNDFFDIANFYMPSGVLSSLFWANRFAKNEM